MKYLALLTLLAALSVTAQPVPSDDSSQAGLVGWWTFNEGAGTMAKDYSGNGYNATLSTSSWGVGVIGSAFNCVLGAKITTPSISIGTTFTISLWIKPTSQSSSYGSLVSDSAGNNGLFFKSTQKLSFYSGGNHENITAIPFGTWTHVVATVNSGALTFYLNGSPDGTNSGIGAWTASRMGDDSGDTLNNSLVDDPRIYNRALSAAEVAGLYWEVASQWKQGP